MATSSAKGARFAAESVRGSIWSPKALVTGGKGSDILSSAPRKQFDKAFYFRLYNLRD